MAWHPRQLGEQSGRFFVVTGANSGIGLEAARGLVERGAHVVLAVRDTAKGEKAAARLAGPGSTSIVELDLSDLDQVAGCANTLLDRHDDLTALICNAGVMGGPLRRSAQGFEWQMATNHLGHAAMVAALWPLRQVAVLELLGMGGEWTAAELTNDGIEVFCDRCDGTGEGVLDTRDVCRNCHGSGWRWLCHIEVEQTLERLRAEGLVDRRWKRDEWGDELCTSVHFLTPQPTGTTRWRSCGRSRRKLADQCRRAGLLRSGRKTSRHATPQSTQASPTRSEVPNARRHPLT